MSDSTRFVLSAADNLLFEHGEFDPIELLLSVGLLDEDEHRDWQAGHRSDLQSILLCDVDEAIEALRQVRIYLLKQGLTTSLPAAVGGAPGPRIGSSPAFVELCSSRLAPAHKQRDMFQDSALAVAEHTVRAELGAHRLAAAQEALNRFHELGGNEYLTSDYRQLIDAAGGNNASAIERLTQLDGTLAPLASRCLAGHATGYLAPLWQSLALRLTKTQFAPDAPTLHASYAHSRAGQWQQVAQTIESEDDWPQHPVLMARLAAAYSRLSNREAARRVWTQLCWNHPDAAAQMLASASDDPVLAKRWREFCDLDPELPVRDFPAWLLIADARQRELVPADFAPETAAGAAYAAVHRLVSNPDDIAARTAVNQCNKELLRHYLMRRNPARRG